MENELLFEHLVNDHLSTCYRWADLYRGASVVPVNQVKEVKVCLCLELALSNLMLSKKEFEEDISNQLERLRQNTSFQTADEIITLLRDKNILF